MLLRAAGTCVNIPAIANATKHHLPCCSRSSSSSNSRLRCRSTAFNHPRPTSAMQLLCLARHAL